MWYGYFLQFLQKSFLQLEQNALFVAQCSTASLEIINPVSSLWEKSGYDGLNLKLLEQLHLTLFVSFIWTILSFTPPPVNSLVSYALISVLHLRHKIGFCFYFSAYSLKHGIWK